MQRADTVAAWACDAGIAPGEAVCLLMRNCPDYVAIWLGLSAVGCVVALINTGLAGDGLVHAIRASGARRAIVEADLGARFAAIADRLPNGLRIEAPPPDRLHSGFKPRLAARADRALLIGTSGTTGLPKSANVTHARVLEWSAWFAGLMDVDADDRLYDCLPMYHSIGGVVAIGAMLCRGGSVLIRERFSASAFWPDVARGGCTIFQYIGELCRYLINSPGHPLETAHRLRLCCGNGLRHEVWQTFQDRFRIPRILEFYAATEGRVSLYNVEGKPGAIGRIPPFLGRRFAVELIRSDVETGAPRRTREGLCMRCDPDEPGEAIAPASGFDGYTDAVASARKLLRDVFAIGDCWYRTGDLMRRDRMGFYSFVDRIGDTYRFKGENVSTMQVAGVIASYSGVSDAAVWGVAVEGVDGRAGMAAISSDDVIDLAALRAHLERNLPPAAQPAFLRVCPGIATTGTFRPIKTALVSAGLSLAPELGALWFNDRKAGRFVACDAALRDAIQDGAVLL